MTTILVGLGMTIALPIVAYILLPGEEWIGAAGLIVMLGGSIARHYANKDNRLRAVQAYGVTSIAFLTFAFGFVTIGVDRYQNAKPMLAAIHRDNPNAVICEYQFHRQSIVYYAGRPINCSNSLEELQKFLDANGDAYIVTLEEHQKEIEENYPGQFDLFLRQVRFLEPRNLIKREPSCYVVLKRTESPKGDKN